MLLQNFMHVANSAYRMVLTTYLSCPCRFIRGNSRAHIDLKKKLTLISSWSLKTKQPNYCKTYMTFICLYRVIREESSIFCRVVVSVIVRKSVHMNMCIILNGYRNGAVWISRLRSLRFFSGEMNEKQSLRKKYEYLTRFARWHFECCCPHKEAWRSVQTKKGYLRTQAAKCTNVECLIFEQLL